MFPVHFSKMIEYALAKAFAMSVAGQTGKDPYNIFDDFAKDVITSPDPYKTLEQNKYGQQVIENLQTTAKISPIAKVAEKFALRLAIDNEYILLQDMVRKTDIICAYDNRKEKEVVVLPKKVIIVGRERANDPILRGEEFKKFSDTSNVYHMVQTGRYRQLQSDEDLRSLAESHWIFDIEKEGLNTVRKYVLWFDDLIALIAKHNLDKFAPSWFAHAHDRYVTGKDILEGDPRNVVKQAEELKRAKEKLHEMNGTKPVSNAELDDIIDNAMRQAEENDAKKK